jgi:hypothetical protein
MLRPLASSVANSLARTGFAVVDGALAGGAAQVAAVREEIAALSASGKLTANATHFHESASDSGVAGSSPSLLFKRGIIEGEISVDQQIRAPSPLLSKLADDSTLRKALGGGGDNGSLPAAPLQRCKVQVNGGDGACFPIHFDADPEIRDGPHGSQRCVTAILYLNDESWDCSQAGGALRLFPFPFAPIDFAPVSNRLVLFSSSEMAHRVLRSRLPRYCLTFWLYRTCDDDTSGDKTNDGGSDTGGNRPHQSIDQIRLATLQTLLTDSPELASWPERELAALSLMMTSKWRRHFTRLVLAESWAGSILESHPDGPEVRAAVETHYAECGSIARLAVEAIAEDGGCFPVGDGDLPGAAALLKRVASRLPLTLPQDNFKAAALKASDARYTWWFDHQRYETP